MRKYKIIKKKELIYGIKKPYFDKYYIIKERFLLIFWVQILHKPTELQGTCLGYEIKFYKKQNATKYIKYLTRH